MPKLADYTNFLRTNFLGNRIIDLFSDDKCIATISTRHVITNLRRQDLEEDTRLVELEEVYFDEDGIPTFYIPGSFVTETMCETMGIDANKVGIL